MVRCSRRPTRDRRHAVRRGDFSLLPRLAHEDFAHVELRVDTDASACALPCPIPLGGTRAAFPPEPTHSCVRAGSAGQGRPGSAARIAGCLDGRADPARDTGVSSAQRMREHPDRLAGPSLVLACGEFLRTCVLRPRFVGGARRGGYRDACSIARSLRGLLDACSIPRRGHPIPDGACDRPALPADPVPPVEHRGPPAAARRPVPEQDRRADSARQGRACQSEGTAQEPPALPVHTAMEIAVWAKWRRGVGRQARQSGGEL